MKNYELTKTLKSGKINNNLFLFVSLAYLASFDTQLGSSGLRLLRNWLDLGKEEQDLEMGGFVHSWLLSGEIKILSTYSGKSPRSILLVLLIVIEFLSPLTDNLLGKEKERNNGTDSASNSS